MTIPRTNTRHRFCSAFTIHYPQWAFCIRRILLILPVLMLFVTPMRAQITGGIIQGIVTDPNGAAVPSAKVTVTNTATQVSTSTETNSTGLYVFPTLLPGPYELTVLVPGFSNYTRQAIALSLQQNLRVDVSLQLGSVQQSVEVSGTPTLLDTQSASVSTLISSQLVESLPILGRNPLNVSMLVPGSNGVNTMELYARPVDTFGPSNFSMNGTPAASKEILVDGVADQYGTGAMGFTPNTYSVEAVRVQTFAMSAEFGETGGSVVTFETKSGTNRPHGTTWYYHHDQGFDANNYFNNRFGRPRPPRHDNQYGFAFGAPIVIPGLYNGKDRSFFFVDYEGYRGVAAYNMLETVPTQAERNGDFSQVFGANGQLIQIYDPFSLHADPATGRLVRDPFPGNKIPASMINKIAANVLDPSIVPLPNLPGSFNNFLFTPKEPVISDQWHVRIDHHISSKDWLFGSWGWIKDDEFGPGTVPSNVSAYENIHPGFLLTLGYTHVFSPTRMFDLRAGVQRDHQNLPPQAANKFIDKLGLPANLTSIEAHKVFPIFVVASLGGIGRNAQGNSFINPDLQTYFTQIIGRHSLKFGYEGRVFRTFSYNLTNEAGTYNFTSALTQGPLPNVSSSNAGVDWASFLLGTPASGSIQTNANNASQSVYNSGYVQDDWRATRRLTLNLGLRYDYQTPVTERFNRMNRGFDFASASPIVQQVNANLAKNPVPGISSLNLLGGLQFAGAGGQSRYNFNPVYSNFMPRVGAAFQLTPQTVIRGAYGMFTPQLTDYTFANVFQSQLPITQLGFSSSTSMNTTAPNGLPLDTLNNPFPNGQVQPVGSSLGLATLLGQSVTLYDVNAQRPKTQMFQFSVQRQLARDIVLNLGYVGSRTKHLPVNQNIDPIPENYVTDPTLSPGGVYAQVPNPFAGIIPIGTLSLANVSLPQLLRPYPQFTGVSIAQRPFGTSRYNSLQLSVSKRMAHGLSFQGSYTWSRTRDKIRYLDAYHPLADDVAQLDRPQIFVISGIWELPVGKGRTFGSDLPAPLRYTIGGWNFGWITTFESGLPTGGWNNAIMVHPIGKVNKSLNQWFDTSAFLPLPPYTLPTLLPYQSQIRAAGSKNFDLTLTKSFPIRESIRFTMGANFYNAFNTPIFAAPNINVTSPAFGTVTGQANNPRWIMLHGELSF